MNALLTRIHDAHSNILQNNKMKHVPIICNTETHFFRYIKIFIAYVARDGNGKGIDEGAGWVKKKHGENKLNTFHMHF